MAAGCEALGAWDCRHLRCQRSSDGARSPAQEPSSQRSSRPWSMAFTASHAAAGLNRCCAFILRRACEPPAPSPPPKTRVASILAILASSASCQVTLRALSRIAASPPRRACLALPHLTSPHLTLPHRTLPRPTYIRRALHGCTRSAPKTRCILDASLPPTV
jgi:hypothetical protein